MANLFYSVHTVEQANIGYFLPQMKCIIHAQHKVHDTQHWHLGIISGSTFLLFSERSMKVKDYSSNEHMQFLITLFERVIRPLFVLDLKGIS
jgi:hypothetical protein